MIESGKEKRTVQRCSSICMYACMLQTGLHKSDITLWQGDINWEIWRKFCVLLEFSQKRNSLSAYY